MDQVGLTESKYVMYSRIPDDVVGVIVDFSVSDHLSRAIWCRVSKSTGSRIVTKYRRSPCPRDHVRVTTSATMAMWLIKEYRLRAEDVMERAAWYNNSEVVKACYTAGYQGYPRIICMAAGHGNLDLVKWLFLNGAPHNEAVCCWASGKGHLDVLMWLNTQKIYKSPTAIRDALKGGHREVAIWLRDNGWPVYEWDRDKLPD